MSRILPERLSCQGRLEGGGGTGSAQREAHPVEDGERGVGAATGTASGGTATNSGGGPSPWPSSSACPSVLRRGSSLGFGPAQRVQPAGDTRACALAAGGVYRGSRGAQILWRPKSGACVPRRAGCVLRPSAAARTRRVRHRHGPGVPSRVRPPRSGAKDEAWLVRQTLPTGGACQAARRQLGVERRAAQPGAAPVTPAPLLQSGRPRRANLSGTSLRPRPPRGHGDGTGAPRWVDGCWIPPPVRQKNLRVGAARLVAPQRGVDRCAKGCRPR